MSKTGRHGGGVRIIGGEWRGRRLAIPPGASVRPTPDRVRETVFNWLGPGVAGMRCLDLFAGTGAFGFEALSRGADEVVMIEQDPRLIAALRDARAILAATGAVVLRGDAQALLAAAGHAPVGTSAGGGAIAGHFDLVVVDPPYRFPVGPLVDAAAAVLAPGGFVYIERPAGEGLPELNGFYWHRRSRAGAVEFGLARRA